MKNALFTGLLLGLAACGFAGCDDDDDADETRDAALKPAPGCGMHGAADAVTGACNCEWGYSGDLCDRCAAGWKTEGESTCVYDCGSHGKNNPLWTPLDNAVPQCLCDEGYAGQNCDACAEGWNPGESDGICVDACGAHGKHNPAWDPQSDRLPQCLCDEGYAGQNCDACAEGFQDHDNDGLCAQSCALAAPSLDCGPHGFCDDSTGAALCARPDLPAWTVMVYLDGDNDVGYDLDEDGNVYDIAANELDEIARGMKQAGEKASNLNVVVLHDQNREAPDPSSHVYQVTSEGLQEIDTGMSIFMNHEADMSSEKSLMRFGSWSIDHFPADKYALILWDHGGGWKNGFSSDDTNGLSIDLTPKGITFLDGAYGRALETVAAHAGKKLDLVGFNACLMGMYEVAKETARGADYLVASSDTMYGPTGFNYDVFVEALAETPEMNGADLGRVIVNAHADTLTTYPGTSGRHNMNKLLALYDLSRLPALDTALDAFGHALADAAKDADGRAVIAEIAQEVQRFHINEHADLTHLAQLAEERAASLPTPAPVSSAAAAVQEAAQKVIDLVKVNSDPEIWGYSIEHAQGMALFFPRGIGCQYYVKSSPDIYAPPKDALYNDFYTMSFEPCIYYPRTSALENEGMTEGNYNLRDVKQYIAQPWNAGWSEFLRVYLEVEMGE